ncbi:Hsp20/alpha crystallin family protein [Caproiciproducens sp. NJN-50]|uniref:Hsp20/alpha crystallin family protein n=1 Tax=Acutalibacteraceae TaxID=3082771 RepID=UPI000FFDFE96|nr:MULTISPECIES: Hsp20/alpha crystallin family protein [Acutalibacteraceae]QAT50385.1 Hsp20/alpha crystallin family protein [Caproiciproducens sp. NJN-50]
MFDLIPFRHSESSLFDEFDRMMGESFWNGMDSFHSFRTDILDKGDRYVLKADLPGFQKQEINISVEGDRLVLSAEHKEEGNENKKNYLRRERRYGAFSRSFDISGIDPGRINASYQNGVLELELPKLVQAKPQEKRIEVK